MKSTKNFRQKIYRNAIAGLVLFTSFLAVPGCKKADPQTADPVEIPKGLPENEVLKIPIVVHVVYNNPLYNVSDEKIFSQISALNLDYSGTNGNKTQLPRELFSLVADMKIQFELAHTDPQGRPTTGIERRSTPIDGLDGNSVPGAANGSAKPLYNTAKGGMDIWPSNRYLNIYVALLPSRTGGILLAGYSQFPGGEPGCDAVVVDPRCFGTTGVVQQGFELGRTVTHEIGHWLNLKHVFDQDDFVADTPSGGMPYNFMDYADDQNLLMFTQGQKHRARAIFLTGGSRREFYENLP